MGTVKVKWNMDDILSVSAAEWHDRILMATRERFLKKLGELEDILDKYCDDISNRRTFIRDVYQKVGEIQTMVKIDEKKD